jgi:hypothetical protein
VRTVRFSGVSSKVFVFFDEKSLFLSFKTAICFANHLDLEMFYFTFAAFLNIFIAPHMVSERHTFHVSKCELAYVAKTKTVQISLHLFIDDLENALKQTSEAPTYIGTPRETNDANARIAAYIATHFKLQTGKNTLPLKMIGKEKTKDLQAIYLFLEAQSPQAVSKLLIQNQLLTELYSDQKNIVETTLANGKQGLFTFTKRYFSDTIVF